MLTALPRCFPLWIQPCPFWTHMNFWHSDHLVLLIVLYGEADQHKSWVEQFPWADLKLEPSICLRSSKSLSHTWKPWQSWPWQAKHTVSRNMRGYSAYFLMLGEDLKTYSPSTVKLKGSQRFLPGPQSANHLLTYKTFHSSSQDDTCEQSHPTMIPVWFPSWKKTRSKLCPATDVLHANICFHKS